MSVILGLSAYYHDSAAALVIEGKVVAAAQEERFTRKRHDARFPAQAIAACLAAADLPPARVDKVVFYDKPFLKFERLLETYLAFAPRGYPSFARAMPLWLKEKLFQRSLLLRQLRQLDPDTDWASRLLFSEHHLSHAASAFFPSPFEEAAVLTMDGVGEWATTSAALGRGNQLEIYKEIHFPHSLGLLYSAFTYYTGFKVNSGEYKLMGLAPYGRPIYADTIRKHLIDLKPDGSFHLDQRYFEYCTGQRMTSGRFERLFGGPARTPEEPLTQRHMDLAASIQLVTEEVVVRLTRALARETGSRNLCLAGGVALNCVANAHIRRDGRFDQVWVQPAAGDAGGALGAALAAHHMLAGAARTPRGDLDDMGGAFLGPAYSDQQIATALNGLGAVFRRLDSEAEIVDRCARALAEGKALGWFQGRMEFGPRALGARSILADPRSPAMQSELNLKVKFRESFRPFAPAVLSEEVDQWFDLEGASPYMLTVADVLPRRRRTPDATVPELSGLDKLKLARSEIPAVTHVDYSARVQTVHRQTNPRFHALLSAFKDLTGCPVLVNTSFNVRGEPIVCSPADAFRCFMGTRLDVLAVGDFLMLKQDQPAALRTNYERAFEPD